MVAVATGDGFDAQERLQIDKAVRAAETICRYEFSVYVGPSEADSRGFAERLHAALVAPDRSILVMVDPAARVLEVVTGKQVRGELTDHEVSLAVVEMQSHFAAGNLVDGIVRGVTMLASYAHKPRTLHARR